MRCDRIVRLINEKQLSTLANISATKLQELRRQGKLRAGIDYRLIDGATRIVRFPYPAIIARIWELGEPKTLEEPSGIEEAKVKKAQGDVVINVDWRKISG